MSVDYVWVCDERKEYLDPYPLSCPHLFVWCSAGITKAAAGGYTHGWYDLKVRLLSDCGGGNDEYYIRTASSREEAEACGDDPEAIYRNVTADAKALAAAYYPGRWWEAE